MPPDLLAEGDGQILQQAPFPANGNQARPPLLDLRDALGDGMLPRKWSSLYERITYVKSGGYENRARRSHNPEVVRGSLLSLLLSFNKLFQQMSVAAWVVFLLVAE